MDKSEISALIGERLHALRRERGMSLDTMAAMTGVSKPMLGQIERGVSNPTVATLWKIASGLGVPFTAFIVEESQIKVIRAEEQAAFFDDEDRYQVYNTFTSAGGNVEVFRMRLMPGCHRSSEPHARGVVESLTVFSGTMEIFVANVVHHLSAGDTLSFPGDMVHEYRNGSHTPAEGQLVLLYT